jgi:hypothetical protein
MTKQNIRYKTSRFFDLSIKWPVFIWDRDDESKILCNYGPNRKRDPALLTPNIFFWEIRNPQVE